VRPGAGEGAVGIVTGGLSGIGAATALALAREGVRLVLADRRTDGADALLRAVRGSGGDAVVHRADVGRAEEAREVAARALERFGRIDLVVANAGVALQGPFTEADPARVREVVETNLLGTLNTIRFALPHLIDRRSGHVFVVSSISGREPYPGEAAYIATKWAQVGFAHAIRQEVRDAGVRVTLIEPGLVDTPLTRENPAVRPLLEACDPLAPEDIAGAIVYAWRLPPHVAIGEIVIRPQRQGPPSFFA